MLTEAESGRTHPAPVQTPDLWGEHFDLGTIFMFLQTTDLQLKQVEFRCFSVWKYIILSFCALQKPTSGLQPFSLLRVPWTVEVKAA